MGDAEIVVGVGDDALHLHLLAVVGVRVAPRDAQLDGPAVYVVERYAATANIIHSVRFDSGRAARYSLSDAVRRRQHPLVGDEDASAVENLFRAAEYGRQKGPVAGRRLRSTHDARPRPMAAVPHFAAI